MTSASTISTPLTYKTAQGGFARAQPKVQTEAVFKTLDDVERIRKALTLRAPALSEKHLCQAMPVVLSKGPQY